MGVLDIGAVWQQNSALSGYRRGVPAAMTKGMDPRESERERSQLVPAERQTKLRPVSRRQFLKQSAAFAGALRLPAIVPSSALCKAGTVTPSNRVGLGCIGLGIQGTGNMRTFRGNPDVQVLAVCDVHETQRNQAKKAVDEFYDSKDCTAYKDFRELMDRKDIDAVQITAPDHWHPLMAMEAVRRGNTCTARSPSAGASALHRSSERPLRKAPLCSSLGPSSVPAASSGRHANWYATERSAN